MSLPERPFLITPTLVAYTDPDHMIIILVANITVIKITSFIYLPVFVGCYPLTCLLPAPSLYLEQCLTHRRCLGNIILVYWSVAEGWNLDCRYLITEGEKKHLMGDETPSLMSMDPEAGMALTLIFYCLDECCTFPAMGKGWTRTILGFKLC